MSRMLGVAVGMAAGCMVAAAVFILVFTRKESVPIGAEVVHLDHARSPVAPSAPQQWRSGHAACRLADGRVVIVGGKPEDWRPYQQPQTTELFEPRDGTWSPGPTLGHPRRVNASCVTLNDGSLLVVGGRTALGNVQGELLTPGGSSWRRVEGAPLDWAGADAVALPGGGALVTSDDRFYELAAGSTQLLAAPDPVADLRAAGVEYVRGAASPLFRCGAERAPCVFSCVGIGKLTLHRFDTNARRWERGPSLLVPNRSQLSSVVMPLGGGDILIGLPSGLVRFEPKLGLTRAVVPRENDGESPLLSLDDHRVLQHGARWSVFDGRDDRRHDVGSFEVHGGETLTVIDPQTILRVGGVAERLPETARQRAIGWLAVAAAFLVLGAIVPLRRRQTRAYLTGAAVSLGISTGVAVVGFGALLGLAQSGFHN